MKTMKKLPFILLLVLLAVYLCAVGAAGPAVRTLIVNSPDAPCGAAPLSHSPGGSVSIGPDCAVSTVFVP